MMICQEREHSREQQSMSSHDYIAHVRTLSVKEKKNSISEHHKASIWRKFYLLNDYSLE